MLVQLLAMVVMLGAAELPPNGLCVFDYDNTITRGMGWYNEPPWTQVYKQKGPSERQCGAPLPMDMWWDDEGYRIYAGVYAANAVKACVLNNMRVGLASASHCPSIPNTDQTMISRVHLLEELGFPSTVAPGGGQRGPAYGCLNSTVQSKGEMVVRLAAYYGIPSLEQAVIFDDYAHFLHEVSHDAPGVHTVLASSGDGCNGKDMFCATACGLSKSETEDGLRQVLGHKPVMPHEQAQTVHAAGIIISNFATDIFATITSAMHVEWLGIVAACLAAAAVAAVSVPVFSAPRRNESGTAPLLLSVQA